ncbi:unnamed protein product [Effrenium voratum]|nr:unnamed protein product [Effrenium voratum]
MHTEPHVALPTSAGLNSADRSKALTRIGFLSFFQVDEVKEQTHVAAPYQYGGEVVVNFKDADGAGELPLSLSRLRTLVWVLKVLLVLAVLWKGCTAFTRLISRTASSKEGFVDAACCEAPCPKVREEACEEESKEMRAFLPTMTAADVEQLLPAFGGYDCALSKPKSLGGPLRLRARIYGPLGEPITTPLTNEAAVFCQTKVEQKLPDGQMSIALERSESVDFVACLEGAPDMKLTVHAKEVRLCDMQEGHTTLCGTRASVPQFQNLEAAGHPDQELQFQETSLRVGELVTLVGDLHRDAAGQLMLWPSTSPETAKQQAVYDLLDGVHVLISDDPAFGAKAGTE